MAQRNATEEAVEGAVEGVKGKAGVGFAAGLTVAFR